MDIIALLILGAFVGFLSSFFGIGGGSLIVPLLYSLYPSLSNQAVISISLGTIFLITLVNSYRYYKLKLTPTIKVIIIFSIACIIGAFLGSQLTYLINKELSRKIIAAILILIVVRLNFSILPKAEKPTEKSNKVKLSLTGFFGSIISSITGLGGGIIFTPMLISVVKLPLKQVAPHSNIAMVTATLTGVIPHLFEKVPSKISGLSSLMQNSFIGNVNIAFILLIFASAFFTAKLGIKLNSYVKEQTKKRMLSALLILLSIKLLM